MQRQHILYRGGVGKRDLQPGILDGVDCTGLSFAHTSHHLGLQRPLKRGKHMLLLLLLLMVMPLLPWWR